MNGTTVTLEELLALRHAAYQLCLPQPKQTAAAAHGHYQSPFRGRGMDFVENRVYQPGDDIRAINWAVTARTGTTHTKLYQQERERPVYIILDLGQSMFFGTRTAFKSVIASHTAALLAWAALKKGDRVGALLINDNPKISPPARSKQSLLSLLKLIAKNSTPKKNITPDVISSIQKLKKTLKSGSQIYFISDFYCLDLKLKAELAAMARQHELINILIYDPLEEALPNGGKYLFHAAHEQRSLLLDTSDKKIVAHYKTIFDNRVLDLKKLCFSSNMHLIELATNDDIVKKLSYVLHRLCG